MFLIYSSTYFKIQNIVFGLQPSNIYKITKLKSSSSDSSSSTPFTLGQTFAHSAQIGIAIEPLELIGNYIIYYIIVK